MRTFADILSRILSSYAPCGFIIHVGELRVLKFHLGLQHRVTGAYRLLGYIEDDVNAGYHDVLELNRDISQRNLLPTWNPPRMCIYGQVLQIYQPVSQTDRLIKINGRWMV